MSSTGFEPKNPAWRAAATSTFDLQPVMRSLRISIVRLEPGEVDLAMPYAEAFTQQHGFVHAGIITAGLDNACGIAAFTLMPADSGILTVEFKTNLLAPAKGRALPVSCPRPQAGPDADRVRSAGIRHANRCGESHCHHDRDADGAAISSVARSGRRSGRSGAMKSFSRW